MILFKFYDNLKKSLWNWYESRWINQNWNHESTKIGTNEMRMQEKNLRRTQTFMSWRRLSHLWSVRAIYEARLDSVLNDCSLCKTSKYDAFALSKGPLIGMLGFVARFCANHSKKNSSINSYFPLRSFFRFYGIFAA